MNRLISQKNTTLKTYKAQHQYIPDKSSVIVANKQKSIMFEYKNVYIYTFVMILRMLS